MDNSRASVHKHLANARRIATLLDAQFHIGKFRFGADPLVSLIPGVGSVVATIFSLYILWIALALDLPKMLYARMAWNICLDFLLGEIPVIGNIADFFYKGNIKNLHLLEDYVGSHVPLVGNVV